MIKEVTEHIYHQMRLLMKKILFLMVLCVSCFSMEREELRKSPLSKSAVLNAAIVGNDIERIKGYLQQPSYTETVQEVIKNALRFNQKDVLSLFFKAGWRPDNGQVFTTILTAGSMMLAGQNNADTLLFMLQNNFEINERMLTRAI